MYQIFNNYCVENLANQVSSGENLFRIYKRVEKSRTGELEMPIRPKKLRHQYLDITDEERMKLLRMKSLRSQERVRQFRSKFETDFHIPLFLSPESPDRDADRVVIELRLFRKVAKKVAHNRSLRRKGNKHNLSVPERNKIRKELFLIHRPRYDFHPHGGTPHAIEVKAEFERVNELAVFRAMQDQNWFALKGTEINRYGDKKQKALHKAEWDELFKRKAEGQHLKIDDI